MGAGDRASLTAFLAPPSRRASEPPPQSIPDADVISVRPSKGFWEVPSVRSSRTSLVPSEPPPAAEAREEAKPAPGAAERPEIAPPAAKLDEPTLADRPAVPPTAPSTLAPSAYDTDETTEGAPEDEDLLNGPVAGARPGFFSNVGARAAMGGVVLLLGLWLVVRGRHNAQPADAQQAESGAPAQAAAAATAVVPDLPDIPDEQPTTQTAPVDDATALELQRKARELLSSGQIVEGVAYARRAIAARPLDGDNYILLAAGLQDLGQWQQARNIFSQCVKRSGGPTTVECQYFATQGN